MVDASLTSDLCESRSPKQGIPSTGRFCRGVAAAWCIVLTLLVAGCVPADEESQSIFLGISKDGSGQRLLFLSRCSGLGVLKEVWGGSGDTSSDKVDFRFVLADGDDSEQWAINLDSPARPWIFEGRMPASGQLWINAKSGSSPGRIRSVFEDIPTLPTISTGDDKGNWRIGNTIEIDIDQFNKRGNGCK